VGYVAQGRTLTPLLMPYTNGSAALRATLAAAAKHASRRPREEVCTLTLTLTLSSRRPREKVHATIGPSHSLAPLFYVLTIPGP
jgi:hypothetical protein